MTMKPAPSEPVLANLAGLLPELETIYKDIHSHPELSMQEERTAGWLRTTCAPSAMK